MGAAEVRRAVGQVVGSGVRREVHQAAGVRRAGASCLGGQAGGGPAAGSVGQAGGAPGCGRRGSGVWCLGLWVVHPSGCGRRRSGVGVSGFGGQRAVHRVVGSGGQACGVSGFWGQRALHWVAGGMGQQAVRWAVGGSGVQYLGHGVGVAGVRPQTPEEAQPWITLEQHCVESWWSWCRRRLRAPT
jgi:hypothetical protein